MSKRNLTSVLGLALTGFFLWLALRNVDLRQVGAALASADYRYALAAASLTLLSYVLRTARWRIILAPSKTVSVGRLFSPLMIGFAANNLLPARIGEVVRAYAVGRQERISVSLSLATVVVERVCDGLTLLFYLTLLSLVFPLPGIGRQVEGLGMVVFGVALAGIYLLVFREALALRWLALALRPLPERWADRAAGMARSFAQGLAALGRRRKLGAIVLYSLVVWLCEAGHYYLLTMAFGLPWGAATRAEAAVFAMVLINLGILVPAAPGYVGTFHFFGMAALAAFGAAPEQAFGFAVLSHAIQYILVTGIGLLFMARQGVSLGDISRQRKGKIAAGL